MHNEVQSNSTRFIPAIISRRRNRSLFNLACGSYCRPMERRHAIRRGIDRLWEVYDVRDQKVLLVDGVPLVQLQVEEAVDALDLLEGGFLVPNDVPSVG